jgi:hypothetical protein
MLDRPGDTTLWKDKLFWPLKSCPFKDLVYGVILLLRRNDMGYVYY